MRKWFFIGFGFFLGACATKDTQFCECLDTSAAYNKVMHQHMEGDTSTMVKSEIQRLRKEKQEKCADYEQMSGDEMRKRQEACK